MLILFIEGLVIGFVISAPLGPIALLCVQRTLQNGFWVGLATGLGAATADILYGLFAAFSITALSSFLLSFQYWIRLVGGSCLLYFGMQLWRTTAFTEKNESKTTDSLLRAYGSTVLLTLANPITLIAMIAIFSSLAGKHMNYLQALVLFTGIALSATSWWLALTSGVAFFLQQRISLHWMTIINRISGAILLAFGLYALSILF